MDIELNDSLHFLDELVSLLSNSHLGHSVYRNSRHTNRYFRTQSFHHPAKELSVDNLQTELHVKESLPVNGYKMQVIKPIIIRHRNPRQKIFSCFSSLK